MKKSPALSFEEYINSQNNIEHILIFQINGQYQVWDGAFTLQALGYIGDDRMLTKEQVKIIGKKRNEDRNKIHISRLPSISATSDNGGSSLD